MLLSVLIMYLFNINCGFSVDDSCQLRNRNKELRSEYKDYYKDLNTLQLLNQKQEKLLKNFSGKPEKFSFENNNRVFSLKKIPKSHRNDTNWIKGQIDSIQIECRRLVFVMEQRRSAFTTQNKEILGGRLLPCNESKKNKKAFIEQQKKAYYIREKLVIDKNYILSKININSYKKFLSEAKLQERSLIESMKNGNFKLPDGYQTKESVKKNFKANASGDSDKRLKEIKDKAKELNQLKDSIQSLELKDSLWFKPNPYKGLSIRNRLKPTFSWQLIPGSNLSPNQIQTFWGLKFLLTPSLTPILTISNNLGLGYGFDRIQLSNEALGVQVGIQTKIYKSLFVQANFESNILISKVENKPTYSYQPGFVLGLGLNGKPGFFLGLNLLQTNVNTIQFSSLITRITF